MKKSLKKFLNGLKKAECFKTFLLLFIKGYQWMISPLMSPCCRFFPSCSNYAYEAISRYGIGKGGYLALKRVLRCHPFQTGGIDPVP